MKSKELGTKHFVSMYSLGPTHAHNTHHAYIVRGATPNSCVEFMSEFPPLLLGNEKRQTLYPRTCFANCKQKVSGPLS